ncbi:hypothetical protein GX51_07281 [Blastomyces parvus]|uniref:Uncharacterized protein n=1 Tax=Blastomyces parvus TaxID=2060905 RepID=A0A2B7WLX9_9EURO|nr:hypothetical protein GX51_07281 [Blastomyces parvus]
MGFQPWWRKHESTVGAVVELERRKLAHDYPQTSEERQTVGLRRGLPDSVQMSSSRSLHDGGLLNIGELGKIGDLAVKFGVGGEVVSRRLGMHQRKGNSFDRHLSRAAQSGVAGIQRRMMSLVRNVIFTESQVSILRYITMFCT